MRNVVCPHCQQIVQVPDDLAQAHCVRCSGALGQTSTQITAAPPMPTPHSIQPIDQFERNAESPRPVSDWDEFRTTSPAVERELLKLARRPMPDLRLVSLRPLPANLPREIDNWKRPLGTIDGPGENFLFFWFTSGAALLMGSIGVLGAIWMLVVLLIRQQQELTWGMLIPPMVFVAVFVRGAWYAFIRGRKLPYTMWVFEEGLLWQLGWRTQGCARWSDVRGFNVGLNPVNWMPYYYELTYDAKTRFVIATDMAPALLPLMEYVEIRLTAAQLLPRLEEIHAGRRLDFGAVQLDCNGIAWSRFSVPWTRIERVVRDRETLFIQVHEGSKWVPIRYASVSLPLVVMALAKILIAEAEIEGTAHAKISRQPR